MMMGPEPMIRILEMSVRLGIFYFKTLLNLSSRPSQLSGEADQLGEWRDLLFQRFDRLSPLGL